MSFSLQKFRDLDYDSLARVSALHEEIEVLRQASIQLNEGKYPTLYLENGKLKLKEESKGVSKRVLSCLHIFKKSISYNSEDISRRMEEIYSAMSEITPPHDAPKKNSPLIKFTREDGVVLSNPDRDIAVNLEVCFENALQERIYEHLLEKLHKLKEWFFSWEGNRGEVTIESIHLFSPGEDEAERIIEEIYPIACGIVGALKEADMQDEYKNATALRRLESDLRKKIFDSCSLEQKISLLERVKEEAEILKLSSVASSHRARAVAHSL